MTRRATQSGRSRRRDDAANLTTDSHIDRIRREEQAIDQVQAAQVQCRSIGRRAVGVTGDRDAPRFGAAIARVGYFPLVALGFLGATIGLQRYGLLMFSPSMGRSLGVSGSAFALVGAVQTLAIGLTAMAIAALARSRMARFTVGGAFAASVTTLLLAFATGVGEVLSLGIVGAVAVATAYALHLPLLVDSHPPESRVRCVAFYHAAAAGGVGLAALIVIVSNGAGLSWRGGFVTLGVVSLAAAAIGTRLREPTLGRWDTSQVREVVDPGSDHRGEEVDGGTRERFFEVTRRLILAPTVRQILLANVVLGMFSLPMLAKLMEFVEEQWRLGLDGQSGVLVVTTAFVIAALGFFATRGEKAFRDHPAQLLRLGGVCLGTGGFALGLAPFTPWLWTTCILFGIAVGLFSAVRVVLDVTLLSIVSPAVRPHAAALAGGAYLVLGGLGGLAQLDAFGSRFGTDVGFVSIALAAFPIALSLHRDGARSIAVDLDRSIDETVEREVVRSLVARGSHLPLLACRRINFSYGQLQVLFDVDFTVDDGDMLALLGTNGAGKSTLLRVISGLGRPSSGSVRFQGRDITFLDAERRLQLGVTQIPGGRAVFGTLSVVENLRAFGYTYGGRRQEVERGLDESFEAFPQLAERRDHLASTLSGGEQQMLGLARALVLKPRLLLIDELSLGLAPTIVADLLEIVRRINQSGTAVVLVEQSVNVALSLVEHAYFMEKGEIRFDGPARDLLGRTDLLRSVFLEGATKGLAL